MLAETLVNTKHSTRLSPESRSYTMCELVHRQQRFAGTYNPEEKHRHLHRRENLNYLIS
jgi:hypothetical protein